MKAKVNHGGTSTKKMAYERQYLRRCLCVSWIEKNRPDVALAIRLEAEKSFPRKNKFLPKVDISMLPK